MKLISTTEAAALLRDGWTVSTSGFTGAGGARSEGDGRAHLHGCADVCSQNVTGPSFTRLTFMSALKVPVFTGKCF